MSQRYPIICEFCLVELGHVSQNRLYDMKRKHLKLMHDHSSNCPSWNDKALKVIARNI